MELYHYYPYINDAQVFQKPGSYLKILGAKFYIEDPQTLGDKAPCISAYRHSENCTICLLCLSVCPQLHLTFALHQPYDVIR